MRGFVFLISGREVWMANATGHIDRFDVRKKCIRGSLKGRITGSIRSLELHPDRTLIASVGLDRYLRLHDTQQKSLRLRLYVKYQCTSVCFMPVPEGYEGEDVFCTLHYRRATENRPGNWQFCRFGTIQYQSRRILGI